MAMNIEGYVASILTIEERAAAVRSGKPPETYTEKLMASQNERVKKLSSETGELIREDSRPDFDFDRFIAEMADFYYSLEVMIAARGLSFASVGLQRSRIYVEVQAADPDMIDELLTNRPLRWQSLGSAAMRVVSDECGPDFDEDRFVYSTANALLMSDFMMLERGLTPEPVMDELIRRNQATSGL